MIMSHRESDLGWLRQLPAIVMAIAIMWVSVGQLLGCSQQSITPTVLPDTQASAGSALPPAPTPAEVSAPADPVAILEHSNTTQTEPVAATPMATESKAVQSMVKEPHPRAAQHKQALIQQARYVWGLKAPVASFAAQIHQESRWNPNAKSPVGTAGLTQFMPATAKWIGTYDRELSTVDVYNPRWAMRALAVYDKFLYDKVSGKNSCERLTFAMSAYNGGLGWVNKRKARSATPDICFGATCEINPGISAANQRENANYPKLILKQYEPLYVRSGWGYGAAMISDLIKQRLLTYALSASVLALPIVFVVGYQVGSNHCGLKNSAEAAQVVAMQAQTDLSTGYRLRPRNLNQRVMHWPILSKPFKPVPNI